MREILFRGKRVDNGEWVEGDFCHPHNICKEEIGYDELLKQSGVPLWNDYDVIPETVGQYTGLCDKDGKRIFEGDIVKVGIYYYCGCYPHTETRLLEVKIPDFYCWQKDGMEVIGNIHDNPELLEEV